MLCLTVCFFPGASSEPPLGANSDEQAVGAWLQWKGLGSYVDEFKTESIDGEAFFTLGEEDLKALGVAKLGQRRWILSRIAQK